MRYLVINVIFFFFLLVFHNTATNILGSCKAFPWTEKSNWWNGVDAITHECYNSEQNRSWCGRNDQNQKGKNWTFTQSFARFFFFVFVFVFRFHFFHFFRFLSLFLFWWFARGRIGRHLFSDFWELNPVGGWCCDDVLPQLVKVAVWVATVFRYIFAS